MKKGNYILLEGGEGCGKSTQAKLLYEYFLRNEIECVLSREPGGIKESEEIRKILLNPENNLSNIGELFLFEAARTEFFAQLVKPTLEKGTSLIADRSGYSTEAYQGYAGGIGLNLIRKLNDMATLGIKPDLTFIIDIDPEKGLKKEKNPDRFASKGLEYHIKVREGFLDIAKNNPETCILIHYRNREINETQKIIRDYVNERLNLF